MKPPAPLPPISDKDYALWSPQLDDVDAEDVREVWFDAYRFTGKARVVGGFALRPVRMARVGPASVSVTRGDLRLGEETVLEGLSGHVDATIASFDPREVSGVSFLRYVTAAVRGDGRIASLRFLNHYVPETSDPKMDGGGGPAHVDVRVVGGVLASPSTVSVDSEPVVITVGERRATASAHIALSVQAGPERPEATVSIDLAGLDVGVARANTPIFRAARIAVFGRSADLDLVRPFGDGTGSVEVPEADLPDLRLFNPYFGKDAASLRAGRAHVRGAFSTSLPAHNVKGNLAFVTDGLVVHVADTDVHLALHAAVMLDELDLHSWLGDLSGSRIEARDVVLSSAPKEPVWWGRVDLEKAHLSLAGPALLHAKFTLQAKDGRPVLRQLLPVWLANLIGLDGLHGGGTVTMGASLVDVTGLHVEGEGCEIRAEYDKRGPRSRGVALVRSGQSTLGVERNDGATSLTLFGAEDWYRRAVEHRAAHGRI
jgi:hypothetical protein